MQSQDPDRLPCSLSPLDNRSRLFAAALVAALALSCAVQRAAAQAYPTRPVTVIVPFAAGGGNDILARLLTQHMGRALGQQFVIENRPAPAAPSGRAPSPRRRRTATR